MSETHETRAIELSQETYNDLAAAASSLGMTPEEWIRSYLPCESHSEKQKTIGDRLQEKGLIGLIDSSQPDADSPSVHTEFGQLLAEKFRKQGLRTP
ncbi:MAG: hypothetical protein AB7P14_21645 [Blastocatellales bacterium]